MPSATFKKNVVAVNAPEKIVTLLEIYHPAMPERIYINDDVVDVEVFGKRWLGFPFEYVLPNDEDQVVSAGRIRIANLGGVFVDSATGQSKTAAQWLDQADNGRGVRIRLMQTVLSDPHVEVDIDFELSGISVTREHISGYIKIGGDSHFTNAVGVFFTPETAPGVF